MAHTCLRSSWARAHNDRREHDAAVSRAKKTTAAPKVKPQRDSAPNRRHTEAPRRLREAHREEFQEILTKVWAEDGLEYTPRLTAEERAEIEADQRRQKAKARMEKLLAEFPDLVTEVAGDDQGDDVTDAA